MKGNHAALDGSMPDPMTKLPAPARPIAHETPEQRGARAAEVISRLDAAMPEAKIELDHTTPLELLVAVILSAQCTDRRVNQVSPPLFKDFSTAEDYARSTPPKIGRYISSLGLFRNKAKSLVKLGKALGKFHGGAVPIERAALAKLPGVGPKTAGVVSMHLGGDHAFPVDTHVMRPLLESIVRNAVALLRAKNGGIYEYSQDTRILTVVAELNRKDLIGRTMPEGMGMAG